MGTKIKCSTLFDITKTNITNRRPPSDLSNPTEWQNKRNTQVNFDTLIQVISLRAQPEDISEPKVTEVKLDEIDKFGFSIKNDNPVRVWSFTFYVNYGQVFKDEEGEYGALYADCESVPMINIGNHLPAFLDISPELKNVHFETHEDE
jgi:hypothetical protein